MADPVRSDIQCPARAEPLLSSFLETLLDTAEERISADRCVRVNAQALRTTVSSTDGGGGTGRLVAMLEALRAPYDGREEIMGEGEISDHRVRFTEDGERVAWHACADEAIEALWALAGLGGHQSEAAMRAEIARLKARHAEGAVLEAIGEAAVAQPTLAQRHAMAALCEEMASGGELPGDESIERAGERVAHAARSPAGRRLTTDAQPDTPAL